MPHRRLTPSYDRTPEPGSPSAQGQTGPRTGVHLETDRLEIVALSAADIAALVAYRRDPEVARFQSWDVDYDFAQARRLIDGQPAAGGLAGPGHWLQLGLREHSTGQLVGDIGLLTARDQPDTYALGVTLAAQQQGRGLATEACDGILDLLFEVAGAHRVTATCDVRNSASIRLLRRLGMRHEARLTDADWCKGEWTSVDSYAILATHHPRTASASSTDTSSPGEELLRGSGWRSHPVRSVSFLGVRTEAFLDMRHLYAYVYGAPLLHEAPGVAWFALADGAELHLYATTDSDHRFFGQSPVPGLLVDDYARIERRLAEFGVEWLTQPDTADGRTWRHYRAPDGNVYEIMGPVDTDAQPEAEAPRSSWSR